MPSAFTGLVCAGAEKEKRRSCPAAFPDAVQLRHAELASKRFNSIGGNEKRSEDRPRRTNTHICAEVSLAVTATGATVLMDSTAIG
jgi:hypothetical protein